MRLERVELRGLELPMRQSFETSVGRTDRKRFLLVIVRGDGLSGYGECVADDEPYYLPETNTTVRHVLAEFLIPLALRLEFDGPRELRPALERVRGHEMAKACLEMAVWDWCARRAARPLCALLGGRRERVEAGVSIGLKRDPSELLAAVEHERAAGYRRVKIKIKPGHDVELVAAVRTRFPDLPLMADANSAYTLSDLATLKALDEHGLTMLEQPLGWDDLLDHARLQRELRTPICLDESLRSPAHVRAALELSACRVANVKVARLGGFAAALEVHELALRHSLPLWCGGMLESGIGRLANVHLQTLPGFTLPGDTSDGRRYFEEDLVDPPVTVAADGTLAVPTGAGLGHEIVWPRIERATRFVERFSC